MSKAEIDVIALQADGHGRFGASTRRVPVRNMAADECGAGDDRVAVEEPVEIVVAWDGGERTVAVTMRTPGDDAELAAGFLLTEGVIKSQTEIGSVAEPNDAGRVVVHLHSEPAIDWSGVERNFYMTSSCGVCGKASVEAIHTQANFVIDDAELMFEQDMLIGLPQQLEAQQVVFSGTGSIHAAALFDTEGLRGRVFEDVGRHNALDKLLGASLLAGDLPAAGKGILVSGRASFELVQKARMAGCPVLAAVGAPSSLAIDLAWDADMTLIGFLRGNRFNVYTGPARISGSR